MYDVYQHKKSIHLFNAAVIIKKRLSWRAQIGLQAISYKNNAAATKIMHHVLDK